MKELVTFLAQAIVSHPEAIEVRETESEDGLVVELRVAPEDMGIVIGRRGRTANALRTLVSTAASRQNKRVNLEILD